MPVCLAQITRMLLADSYCEGEWMRRVFHILVMVVILSACVLLQYAGLNAYSSDEESASTEFRENLMPAQQGDAKAQVFVAYLYETGQGVTRNYSKAAEWYSRAARQGNPVAQTQLGNMYRLGRGVPQNYVLAHMWLDLASKQGSRQASELITQVNRKMSRNQLTEANRLAKNWKPEK